MNETMKETYVEWFFGSAEREAKFLKVFPQYYGEGKSDFTAKVISSDKFSRDILFSNGDGASVLVFELTDYDCEVKWINCKYYIERDLSRLRKFWLKTLRDTFKDYKKSFTDHYNSLIDEL